MPGVLGHHHVTAIASDPQRTRDFYGGVLGLREAQRAEIEAALPPIHLPDTDVRTAGVGEERDP